ncbi:MAG: substrate-binding domain-containing protein [Nitrospirae bacterium]|nr:substrate-binding domain-containing protein [Nitrospirota bacterium]
MKKKTDRKIHLWITILLCLLILLVFKTVTYTEPKPVNALRVSAFSDPSQIMDMPEEWKKKSVKHEPSMGDVDIAITLDQQMYPDFFPPIIKKYAKDNNLKIFINEGNCGISGGMLSRKIADIGAFCCPPEKTDRLPGLRFHTFGIAPVAILIHPDNPIDNITLKQARQIFQGEISRWSELKTAKGGKGFDTPIQVVTRLHCKTRPGHWRILLDKEDLFTPNLIDVGAIPDMIAQVATNPKAIGFESLIEVYQYQEEKGKVKILKIDGYDPHELSHLLTLKYPLYHVYSLTTWEREGVANPKAQKLVEYLISQVELRHKEFGVIPVSQLRKAGWRFKDRELIGEPK